MKLNKEKVLVIQSLFQFTEIKDQDIAHLFGVSRELINSIRHGHRWSSVTGILPTLEEEYQLTPEEQRHYFSNDYRDFTTKEEVIIEKIKKQLLEHLANFQ